MAKDSIRTAPTDDGDCCSLLHSDLNGSFSAAKSLKAPYAERLPLSVVSKHIGAKCASKLESVAERMRRDATRQIYSWATTDDLYEIAPDIADWMALYDDRAYSLLTHTGRVQQGLGIIPRVTAVREAKGLKDVETDDIFMESFIHVVQLIKEEIQLRKTSGSFKIPRVPIKTESGRGHGMACASGSEGAIGTRELFAELIERPTGLYHYAYNDAAISSQLRTQFNRVSASGDGRYEGKSRVAEHFVSDFELTTAYTSDGDDGLIGLRARLVNAVPHLKNYSLVVGVAYINSNLPPSLSQMWKANREVISSTYVGYPCHAIDFGQFEATVPLSMTEYIRKELFSEPLVEVCSSIQRSPIYGCYTNFDETNYYRIARDTREAEVAYGMITSGDGDTSLRGKIIGTAHQLSLYCKATGSRPADILTREVDCPMTLSSINGGDDQANGFKYWVETKGDANKIIDKHFELINEVEIFDITVESHPTKIIGNVLWKGQSVDADDHRSPVTGVSLDPLSMVANRVFQEQDLSSPIRPNEYIGLWESINLFREDLAVVLGHEQALEYQQMTLEAIRSPYTLEQLGNLAQAAYIELEQSLESDDSKMAAQMMATKILGLSSPSELAWKTEADELLDKLPPEIIEKLFIIVPTELMDVPSDFLNV